ncbi:MAG: T9SS C-terminal target domain-containing protein [Calditrichaeota bacterium]|nr:MAG: T9SS C-terminal target domain-containing protein [Calditrichota bacterium]
MKYLLLIFSSFLFITQKVDAQIDISLEEIITPNDTIYSELKFEPLVVIQNLSNQTSIGLVYAEIDYLGSVIWGHQVFVNLDSFEIDTLKFNQVNSIVNCTENLNFSVTGYFANDVNPSNDTLNKDILIVGEFDFIDVLDFSIPTFPKNGFSFGAAWGDINDDNLLDLVHIKGNQNYVNLNNGDGTFSENKVDNFGLGGFGGIKTATIIANLDNDQDVDLILGQDIFLHNGDFSNPSFSSNNIEITGFNGSAQAISLLDFNRDSFLDFYVARDGSSRDLLFEGQGITFPNFNLSFVEKGFSLQIAYQSSHPFEILQRHSHAVTCADYNQDGWTDIYVGHDNHGGQFNRLYKNNKTNIFGTQNPFSLVSDTTNTNFDNTWQSAFGDFNNDGLVDIYISATNAWSGQVYNVLYEHSLLSPFINETDYFNNVASAKGVSGIQPAQTYESTWLDFDNDGWLDLFVGNFTSNSILYKNYTNDYSSYGALTQFIDVTGKIKQSNLFDRVTSVSSADFNNDGLIDLFIGTDSTCKLLQNSTCNENNWIQLDLVGTYSNRSAIGTQLKLYSGKLVQYRQIIGGTGRSMESLRVEFGLGQNTYIDSLVIDWPSGIHQTLYNGELTINSINEVMEGICISNLLIFPNTINFLNGISGASDSLWVKIQNTSDCYSKISKIDGKFPFNQFVSTNKNSILIPPQSEDSVLVKYIHFYPILNTSLEIIFNDSMTIEIPVYGELATSIESEKSQLPTEFSLSQNYPNPFNPSTKIEFAIPQASNVQLQIFNVKGRLVKELANSKMNAGFYNFDWNGTDSNGAKVSSGIYFYKLETEGFIQTKKMILLK